MDQQASTTSTEPTSDTPTSNIIELDTSKLQKIGGQSGKDKSTTKILIVEDEPDAREIFTDLLMAAGYEVSSAVDGVDALAKLESEKGSIALVLLDIIMPNKDGVETLENIVSAPEKYGTPKVVMLTNIGGDAAVEKALQLGALGYMLKSETEPQQLIDAVRKYLNGATAPIQSDLTVAAAA
jgi:CheY-like chemotaxis protein